MASISEPNAQQLLNGRYIAALGSINPDGSPHIVSVWYWFDGSQIYIATASRSRKGKNLQVNPTASLMIDSRDPAASFGITITGTAQFLTGESSRMRNEKIHAKYMSEAARADPKVGPVFAGWDDVTIQITPKSVISWDMREADRQVFGSAFEKNPTYLLPVER
jgi:PPOX class probable F420-dependent enzyme